MLGPHVIQPTDAAMCWVRQAPIVKAFDRVDVLESASNDAIRIFRHFLPNQNTADVAGTTNAILNALGGYRHPKLYVEIWNECHPTYEQMRDAAEILHNAGVKTALGSFGTGDYTYQDFENAAGASFPDGVIAVHCYWGNRGFTPYHALRYRQFWQPGDPPVVITECGRDAVESGARGWQASGISAEQYITELVNYANEIAKDHYVIGATPFTAGPSADWQAFSTDAISDQLLARLGAQPVTDTTQPAQPTLADILARLQAIESRLTNGEKRDGMFHDALVDLLKGDYTGAASIAGEVVAMDGKDLTFTPRVPLFEVPKA